jgi:hypothetical protein
MKASVYTFYGCRDCVVVGRMIIFTLYVCMSPLRTFVALWLSLANARILIFSRGRPLRGPGAFHPRTRRLAVCVLLLTFPLFTPRRLRLPHTPITATPVCNTRTSICLPSHNTIVTPHSNSASISIRSTITAHSTQHTYPVVVRPICRSAQSIRRS